MAKKDNNNKKVANKKAKPTKVSKVTEKQIEVLMHFWHFYIMKIKINYYSQNIMKQQKDLK